MSKLQEIFSNREIALGIWILLAVTISIFTKHVRHFLKTVFPILLCRKFIVFYIIFLSYFAFVIYVIYFIGFWNTSLLKDTVFWIIFVELPLFAKTIKKAQDKHFFSKLIKENIQLIVIVEFVFNFWTFGLIVEIIIVPIAVIIGALYAFSARDKKNHQVKFLFELILVLFGVIIIINTVTHIIQNPSEIINLSSFEAFLLPILLLILNIPIVYGLALYSMYEQVFIRIKGNNNEKTKIKSRIIRFAGVYLSKITAVRNHASQTLVVSLTGTEMKLNLDKLEKRLSMQVGENYMKRTRFYIFWCIFGMLAFITGLILSNSYVALKDIVTFNFTMDILRTKEIATYMCSTGIVLMFCFLIYSFGLRKKKNEELSQVKKFSLHSLLYLIKRQHNMLQEFAPIDAPKELFIQYITMAYELKTECDRSIALFENLLTTWELDTIKQLQLSTIILTHNIGIDQTKINQFTPDSFDTYYVDEKSKAAQSETINLFIHGVQEGIEKYTEQIKMCYTEFKHYM